MSDMALPAPPTPNWLMTLLGKITSNFLLRRIIKAIFITWVVATIIFFVIRLMPGSPLEVMVQELVFTQMLTEDEAYARAASLLGINPDEPLTAQYVTFLKKLVRLDFGTSYRSTGVSVSSMIADRLPYTLFSIGISLLLSFIIGITLGMIVAYKRNTVLDHILTNIGAILDAVPGYLTAILLLILFGLVFKMGFTYMRGAYSPGLTPGLNPEFIIDIFRHVAIPALAYILATSGSWMLIMKSSTISTLGEDYVTVARARGLSDGRIISAYVGRNAMLPLATRLAITIGVLVGGSILIEQIFTYRGIGLLLWQAVSNRDYPVMQAVFIVTTIAVIIANLLADLLYGYLDPRIRIAGGNK